MASTIDGQKRVIATAKQILRNLGNMENMKEDMILILSHLGSDIKDLLSTDTDMISADSEEDRFRYADSKECRNNYLRIVDEIVEWDLECSSAGIVLGEVVVAAEHVKNVLKMVMSITKDGFRCVLRDTIPVDGEWLHGLISYHSIAIYDLKEIADRMIRAGYEKECCRVYTCVRCDVIDELLLILGVDKLGMHTINDDWGSLGVKMKKWSGAIRVVLTGEKQLCNGVFAGSELIREVCFGEISRSCVMQLINFAEEIRATKKWALSEKLFRILDMYDALADVLPDLQPLFSDNSCQVLGIEVQGILDRLGETAKVTVEEFENVVRGKPSLEPIHVMNYVKLLLDYSDNLLIKNNAGDSNGNGAGGGCDNEDDTLRVGNEWRLQLLISSLESDIEEMSKLYEDKAMKCIFLMKNNLYLVQKVKGSELGKLLGDQWARKLHAQIRQFATCFLQACSSKDLSCLKGEWVGGSLANVAKRSLKDRFKSFICFFVFRRTPCTSNKEYCA